jgi:NAD+ synthase (glutamine-hydrolysing)
MQSETMETYGMMRVAVVAPELRVADVTFNVARISDALDALATDGVRLSIFPEMALTGYTCGDLFHQQRLLDAARDGLLQLAGRTAEIPVAFVAGLPLAVGGRLFNCAAFCVGGEVIGLVPKTHLPVTQEYYEERWFSRSQTLPVETVALGGREVPIGSDLIFEAENFAECRIGVEICEDLWAVQPKSGRLALAGATVLVNPSASDELLGKAPYRRELVKQQSARCLAAYLYASSGPGESTTDVVFSGHGMICESGTILTESKRFQFRTTVTTADIDLERIEQERIRNSSFSSDAPIGSVRRVRFSLPRGGAARAGELRRPVPAHPFIPDDPAQRAENCHEIFSIQSTGLARRLDHTGAEKAVIGVSGGLDSTLALLVAARALAILQRSPSDILAVVMPGPGSTKRTQENAKRLAEAIGATCRVIPINDAVAGHLRDLSQPENLHDITFENAQARERTQILMDLANQVKGIVVGTGDLSELALGWCTYNGDQMSMYHVNAGVPKTLVRHVVEWCADEEFSGATSDLLRDICATPITPELLPLGEDLSLLQKTEDTIGPYELHDFFLYYFLRFGFRPEKLLFLAHAAYGDAYAKEELAKRLRVFLRMFFASQFKRSAMPDGPKVGTVALSPRGDWRMPSDASVACWIERLPDDVG